MTVLSWPPLTHTSRRVTVVHWHRVICFLFSRIDRSIDRSSIRSIQKLADRCRTYFHQTKSLRRVKRYHELEAQMSLELRRAVSYASQFGWLAQLWCVAARRRRGGRLRGLRVCVFVCVCARASAGLFGERAPLPLAGLHASKWCWYRVAGRPQIFRRRRPTRVLRRRCAFRRGGASLLRPDVAAAANARRVRRSLGRYLRDAPPGCAMDISQVLDVMVYAPKELLQANLVASSRAALFILTRPSGGLRHGGSRTAGVTNAFSSRAAPALGRALRAAARRRGRERPRARQGLDGQRRLRRRRPRGPRRGREE